MSASALALPAPVAEHRRWLVLALVCTAQFMLLVDDTIVNVALPSIRADLGFDERTLTWVVNAYLLTFGGFLLVGGRAADLLGRRRLFMTALTLFTACSLLCGLAESPGLLIGARGAQGLGGALLSPAALSILLVTFPAGRERTRALGVWAALLGLGAATGTVLGGAITETIGWRWVFFLNVPIGIAALALAPRLLPRHQPSSEHDRLDLPGAATVTAGLLALVYTVVQTGTQGWASPRTLLGLGLAALLLAAFAAHEARATAPLVPRGVIRRRAIAAADGATLLAAGALLAMFFFLTLYMQLGQGYSPLRTGLSFLPFSATMVLCSGIAIKALRWIGARTLILAGIALAIIGFVLYGRLQPGGSYAGELLAPLLVTAAGMGLAFVPLMTAATTGVAGRDSGLASGLLTACQQIGGAIGIAVLVTLASDRTSALLRVGTGQRPALVGGFHLAFHVGIGLLLGAGLIGLLIGRVRTDGSPPAIA